MYAYTRLQAMSEIKIPGTLTPGMEETCYRGYDSCDNDSEPVFEAGFGSNLSCFLLNIGKYTSHVISQLGSNHNFFIPYLQSFCKIYNNKY